MNAGIGTVLIKFTISENVKVSMNVNFTNSRIVRPLDSNYLIFGLKKHFFVYDFNTLSTGFVYID